MSSILTPWTGWVLANQDGDPSRASSQRAREITLSALNHDSAPQTTFKHRDSSAHGYTGEVKSSCRVSELQQRDGSATAARPTRGAAPKFRSRVACMATRQAGGRLLLGAAREAYQTLSTAFLLSKTHFTASSATSFQLRIFLAASLADTDSLSLSLTIVQP